MWRSLGVAAGAVATLLGCQGPERPRPITDPVLPMAASIPSLVDPDELPRPDTLSPCGAATVELEFLRPNLYFAMDASGSMLDSIPRGDVSTSAPTSVFPPGNRYIALAQAIQTLLARVGHRVNYGATLFPSADVVCDAGEEIMALTPGDTVSFAVSGDVGPVLGELMFSINRRTPRGGTPVALALDGLVPKLSGLGPESYVFLVTDGGPNCAPDAGCGPEECMPNLERVQLTPELRCEAPINCCDGSIFGPDSCLDISGSRAAVEALARAGIRTFVIGIPGSEAYADVLDLLAQAGGLARPGSPSYYRVSDADELTETVSTLGIEIALSCTIELSEPPPDPTLLNVFFDGQLVPADPVNGWAFRDARTVQMLGQACALMQAGQVLQADIIAGCPIVIQ